MHEQQLNAISKCYERFADGYDGHEEGVLAVIDDCERAIADANNGNVGPWEKRELDYARVAVRHGFLRLALVAAEKALAVNCLPRDEYEYGLNYGRPD